MIPRALAYARRIIDASARPGEPTPVYGSAEWAALPPDDPRRWSSVIIAAECWRTYVEETPRRVAEELQAEQDRCLHRWTECQNDVRGQARMSNDPHRWHLASFEELERRRAEPCPWPPVPPAPPPRPDPRLMGHMEGGS